MTKNTHFKDYLILLLVLLVAMWQLVTGLAIMKWDAMDIYLPWKNFVGESINNGILPLWNPFMNSGFAQMGDPNTWYPVSWLISLVGKYNIYAVHFEYLLHLYIAGIGLYKVTQLYSMSRASRIIVAAAYMLSGFLIGNAQHTGWIISAAWFPFIYFYFVRLRRNPGYIDALKLGFCSFMMFSGGYPGIFIVAFYTLLAFFIYKLVHFLLKRDLKKIWQWLLLLTLSALIFFLLSAVVVISSLDLKAHITRGAGLVFDTSNWGILTGSLTPKALMTFIFPYSGSTNNQNYWGTDFSLVNCYMGIIPVLLLIFVNFQKNISFNIRLLSIIGLLFLLTALAQVFPFRKWLFLFLPWMDLFRFSALFRLFAIFFFLLAAGFGLDLVLTNEKVKGKFLSYLKVILIVFGLVMVVLFFRIEKWQFRQLLVSNFFNFTEIAGIKEKIFLQGCIQTVMIALLYLFFRYRPKNFILFVVFIGCADMILSTQMNLYATVVHNYSAGKVNSAFSNFPQDYPLPSLTLPMSKTSTDELRGTIPYLSQNLAIYHKIPSCNGNSPYGLYNQGNALKNKTYDAIINNPLLFLASFADKQTVLDTGTIDKNSCKRICVTAFNPNMLRVKVETDKPQMLILLQNYYPYWKAKVNGKARPIIETNDTFMGIPIGKGINDVTFEFKPVKVIYAFYLSFVSLIGLITFFMVVIVKRQLKERKYMQLGCNGFFVLMFALLVTLNLCGRQTNNEIYRIFNDKLPAQNSEKRAIKYIFNIDDDKGLRAKDNIYVQINTRPDVANFINLLDTCSSKEIFYAQINKISYPEVKEMINDFYPEVLGEEDFGNSYFIHAAKSIGQKNINNLISFNDFEKDYSNWVKTNQTDSSVAYSGKRCFRLDSVNSYSPVFAKKFSAISRNSNCVFKISLYTKFEQGASPVIVFSARRKEKNITWAGENVNRYFTHAENWRKVFFVKRAVSELEADDLVEIYVWNAGKKKVWIDDIKIELLK